MPTSQGFTDADNIDVNKEIRENLSLPITVAEKRPWTESELGEGSSTSEKKVAKSQNEQLPPYILKF